MQLKKVFIDGREGTTGLEIASRLSKRSDIELITLEDALRKDVEAKRKALNSCDYAILCLPDVAARESVALVENPDVVILDASTAHRTEKGWAYGFSELGDDFLEGIISSKRIAVPGCYASGFLAIVYPLVKLGILPHDYPVVCHAVSGYSGAGKKGIAQYESSERGVAFDAPRQYALSQRHKHQKEMQYIAGLEYVPIFNPYIADYFRGMEVSVPLFSRLIGGRSAAAVAEVLADYYKGKKYVTVNDFGVGDDSGFLAANDKAFDEGITLSVFGNEERILITATLDNLAKGASGACEQCLAIKLEH